MNQAMALSIGLLAMLTLAILPSVRRAAWNKQAKPPHLHARSALARVAKPNHQIAIREISPSMPRKLTKVWSVHKNQECIVRFLVTAAGNHPLWTLSGCAMKAS